MDYTLVLLTIKTYFSPSCFAAVGEPPQCMSCSCLFAVQDAIYRAREETGHDKDYFPLDGPATVEVTQLKCLVDPSQFIM
jgi:xanthine dehydrogenase molybdopterin-binding subunit B